ncbi:ELP3 component of the RNA polymerase II complex, consists of [Candidatus Moduliflexus flocculans]|uniref:ELP3 component of the RNA polymerase II complex, consists of n=1 Tax=Candidatus Moduliflexus flocculans TaxID=1499966 RepID=A0A081BN18_9BACT|nr:ELP3 component of the RNA polymerase II complex, consists of [Candidatus Moduliflexus flocculans]
MKKIIAIFLPHQGCPHRCVFCSQPNITGVSGQRLPTTEEICQQIERALSEPKSQEQGATFDVAFYGGTFTGMSLEIQHEFLRTAQIYVDRDEIEGIRISTHPAMINEAVITLLSKFSVTLVEVGAQSFDDDVLRLARRGHTAEQAEYAIRALQSAGMRVSIHLMIGLPGDSFEKSMASAHKAVELHPACIRLHPTLVIRSTTLADWYRKGRYDVLSLEETIRTCKAMLTLFYDQRIPVARIGLQPTESLEETLIAGPYHPAIRQMVESAIFFDQMAAWCETHPPESHRIEFAVSPQDLSTARGQRNENIRKLQLRFSLDQVNIVANADLARGELLCRNSDAVFKATLPTFSPQFA